MKPEFNNTNKTGTGNAFNKDKTTNAPLGGGKQQHESGRPMGNVTQKNKTGGGIDRTNLGNLGRDQANKTDKR